MAAVLEEPKTPLENLRFVPNFPNSFNLTRAIRYVLSTAVPVGLTVYNTLGQAVRTLLDGGLPTAATTPDQK